MSWQTEMTTLLRFLVYDLDDVPTYTDEKLQQAITVAAQLLQNEINFRQAYTVNIGGPTISPDPTDSSLLRDDSFINLVTMKAACLIDDWTLRVKLPTAGISMRSGPEALDTRGVASVYQYLKDNGYCKAFEEAKKEYVFGNNCPGRAILGPFVGDNVNTDLMQFTPFRARIMGISPLN